MASRHHRLHAESGSAVTTSVTRCIPQSSPRTGVSQLLGLRGGLPRSKAELIELAMILEIELTPAEAAVAQRSRRGPALDGSGDEREAVDGAFQFDKRKAHHGEEEFREGLGNQSSMTATDMQKVYDIIALLVRLQG